MPTYRAAWILPIAGTPIREGWLATRDGRITAVRASVEQPAPPDAIDLGDAVVMPGLVNAHTHLELSWLRGRVRPAASFIEWVSAMMRERTQAAGAGDEGLVRDAMRQAIDEARRCGTAVIGDVSNSLVGLDLLAPGGLSGVVFHELIGFRVSEPRSVVEEAMRRIASARPPQGWRIVPVPHAPYSVSPGLFAAVRERCDASGGVPTAVHVAEGAEEIEFLQTGGGAWAGVLQWLDAWDPDWVAPACGPVEYLDRLGFWSPGTLAVHAVRATRADLALLRERGVTVVTCPRSNTFVGAGQPPVTWFFEAGLPVAVGTDSLASVTDLNVFSELAVLRRLAPAVAASRLLASATVEGARALGVAREYGTLEPGRRAALIAVAVPPGVADVEEYLVGGIVPSQVRWLEAGTPC